MKIAKARMAVRSLFSWRPGRRRVCGHPAEQGEQTVATYVVQCADHHQVVAIFIEQRLDLAATPVAR
jgi:hypothetical protein